MGDVVNASLGSHGGVHGADYSFLPVTAWDAEYKRGVRAIKIQ